MSFFRKMGFEVELVCFVRNVTEWANGAYAQRVKSLLIDREYSDFVLRFADRLGIILGRLLAIQSSGVPVSFVAYNDETKTKGVVRHFLSVIGLDDNKIAAAVSKLCRAHAARSC